MSADHNNNSYNYKHTFSTEIVPICKEDLVRSPLPPRPVVLGIGSCAHACSVRARCACR